MTVHAKEIINGKFWILENNGEKIATLSMADNKFLLSHKKGIKFYDDTNLLETEINDKIIWDKLEITESTTKELYGYPTRVTPTNSVYDISRKLPLFTKGENSKSYYCAGYYIIGFEKGWLKSFCPKLVTLEKYPYEGPFKNKIDMKAALRRRNGK